MKESSVGLLLITENVTLPMKPEKGTTCTDGGWRFVRRKGISGTSAVIAISLLVLTGVTLYAIYIATPLVNGFNLMIADTVLQASAIAPVAGYVFTATEYFLAWYGFRRLMGWVSNRLGRAAKFLFLSWGESDLPQEFATLVKSQMKEPAKWLFRFTGWKIASPAVAVIDWKSLEEVR